MKAMGERYNKTNLKSAFTVVIIITKIGKKIHRSQLEGFYH